MKFIKFEKVFWKEDTIFEEGEPMIVNSSCIESITKVSKPYKLTPEAERTYSERFDVPASELCFIDFRLVSKCSYFAVIPEKSFYNLIN